MAQPAFTETQAIVVMSDQLADGARDATTMRIRIAELEAFVLQIENIETAWVAGATSAQESMIAVHEVWRSVRAKVKPE